MKQGKRGNIFILFLVSCILLNGCAFQSGKAEVLKGSEVKSEGVSEEIQDWLHYKKQVENTQILAEDETGGGMETTVPPVAGVMPASTGEMPQQGFYYSYLSDNMKVVYEEVYEGLLNREETRLSTLSEEQAGLAFQCVLYDHPEIFYVSGYQITKKTMAGKNVEIVLEGKYEMTKDEVSVCQEKIDAYVNTCFAHLPTGADEYEKVKYVFDYLITNTSYNLDAPDNQNICSVFIGGESVCQGYAEATQYLLQKLGIEVTVVPGVVNDGSRHVWNLVKVNGAYYYMDTTWGDVDYRKYNISGEESAPINYDYFLVTSNQLYNSHTTDAPVTMPACVATQDNYYVREGLYFEAVDEVRLEAVFRKAYEAGKKTITIKCANEMVFDGMKQFLLTEQKIFRYVDAGEMISYSEDTGMCTLCFWL